MAAKALTPRSIRYVDLYEGQRDTGKRVAEADAGVREPTCIDDDPFATVPDFVQMIEDVPLVIALEELDFRTQLGGQRSHPSVEGVEGFSTVHLGLTDSE